ncbi:MAG: DUF1573 domain-containing protein [Chitinophagaceae bacterium]|nr:MAG: DUF1573 domain-containing protein [Chitinophagaceae bacterium]
MKPFVFFFVTILFAGQLAAQTSSEQAPKPVNTTPASVEVLGFKQPAHDFGKIPQNRPVTHVFEFTNNGKEPLKLENVQAACGCTTPEWTKDPVAPGANATVKVGYNAAAEGPFSKTVTIFYNGNQMKTLVISGTVYKAPATSAPANASISLLKQTNY